MRKTYAYNSILFGFLLGLLVGMTTESVVLGILAGFIVSVVGFVVVRMIENAIGRGVDKAAQKISEAHRRRKEQKATESGAYYKPVTTQMPAWATANVSEQRRGFCAYCGAKLRANSRYCSACGKTVK